MATTNFVAALNNINKANSSDNISVTENGAVGYKTAGSALVDINFAVSSLRTADSMDIRNKFQAAYDENPELAMRWLFFAADVRGGMGERRLFKTILGNLPTIIMHTGSVNMQTEFIKQVIEITPYYTRWDNILPLLYLPNYGRFIADLINTQITSDLNAMKNGKPASLLAKWLPSVNTSSQEKRNMARLLCAYMHVSERDYRKTLAKLRKYLDVVEVKTSSNHWEDINYNTVPSKANILYRNAFLKHDGDRRREYLSKLEKGEKGVKINGSVNFPSDIVFRYHYGWYSRYINVVDPTLEQLWKNLPQYDTPRNTIVVADGSGSMDNTVSNTNVSARDVANSLAIYFAEKSEGEFKDKYITFSMHPQLVDLSTGSTLLDKLHICYEHDEVANTNIEAVFDLILETAKKFHMDQKNIPDICIISDMEFDRCTRANRSSDNYWEWGYDRSINQSLFDNIKERYERAGYQLPHLTFWNVNSRTGTIPVKENDLGVTLISGYSPAAMKMVLTGKASPYDAIVETISSPRYDPISTIMRTTILKK